MKLMTFETFDQSDEPVAVVPTRLLVHKRCEDDFHCQPNNQMF